VSTIEHIKGSLWNLFRVYSLVCLFNSNLYKRDCILNVKLLKISCRYYLYTQSAEPVLQTLQQQGPPLQSAPVDYPKPLKAILLVINVLDPQDCLHHMLCFALHMFDLGYDLIHIRPTVRPTALEMFKSFIFPTVLHVFMYINNY
jgi:hypothetical protein